MRYEIRLYPNPVHTTPEYRDEEPVLDDLGAPGDLIATIEAEYPMQALEKAESHILATRSETTQQWQRGKRVTMTVYRSCDRTNALAAWMTANGLAAVVPA